MRMKFEEIYTSLISQLGDNFGYTCVLDKDAEYVEGQPLYCGQRPWHFQVINGCVNMSDITVAARKDAPANLVLNFIIAIEC